MNVPIVYIAGSGRTGSTLLSLLLSQGPGCRNVGQTRDLAKAVSAHATCTCGSPVAECAFWGPVVAATDLAEPDAAERVNDLRKAYIASDPWAVGADAGGGYPDFLRALYSAIAAAAPGQVLVDSSKTPEIALALSRLPEFEVTVIHLMRDPRAVACSWERKLGERRRTLRFCRTWQQRFRVLDGWAATGDTPVIPVRYEDFAEQPVATVERIVEASPLAAAPELFADERTAAISWEDQHLFPPANESVLARKATRVEIRPSDGWRRLGNLPLHLAALRHTWPEGVRYCLPKWLGGNRSR